MEGQKAKGAIYCPVSIVTARGCKYPKTKTLFRPSEQYPEYLFKNQYTSEEPNYVYAAVRDALYYLGLDRENFGTKEWNPLSELIQPGNCVLIKPNMVSHENPRGHGTECLYTHPSVVAPIIDYVLLALGGRGKIIVGDAPVQECKFDVLIAESGYKDLIDWYKSLGFDIELEDFRELSSETVHGVHVQHINKMARGQVIDLGTESEFANIDARTIRQLRITNYDPDFLNAHHTNEKHEYYVAEALLQADCIINMPKPKTHRLAGVTISLKNSVGISARKEYLPHHTKGSQEEGGDEYREQSALHRAYAALQDQKNRYMANNQKKMEFLCFWLSRCFIVAFKLTGRHFRDGAWYGNRTINRTVADLNKIIKYADRAGKMCDVPQRKMLIVADMIVSGEKEGPLAPSPKNVGIIATGMNPVCFDEAIATLMGFDVKKIPTLQTVRSIKNKYPLVEENALAMCFSNSEKYDRMTLPEIDATACLGFIPAEGWKKYLEKKDVSGS